MKYLIIIALAILSSCTRLSPKEQDLRNTINKPLHISMFETVQKGNNILSLEEFRYQHKQISVVYLQNSCNPCYPKFIEWQQKMDSIDTPADYTVLFVIKGNSYGDFMTNVLNIEYVEDKYYTVMDPDGKFLANNSEIPRWIIDSSILIDSENKIKMVGTPFATPEMTELFHQIVNRKE